MNSKIAKGIFLMVLSSVCACFGQLLWKLSTTNGKILFLFLGFALYGIGALLMITAYKFGPVSVLQPILSLNYVLSMLLAFLILGESITPIKILGVVVVIFGVGLIATGKSNAD